MSALVEEFNRFADLFPEPIVLVSNEGHLCAANTVARVVLFGGMAVTPDRLVLEFVKDASEKVLGYLRACSRTAQPLPGRLTFLRNREREAEAAYHTVGCAFRSRDDQQRPLVILRLAAQQGSTSRFVALNQQIEQLRRENARRVAAEQLLQEQRELLQVTLASIGDAVLATDTRGCITFMNPVAEAHMGRSQKECLGRPLQDVFVIRNEHTGEVAGNPVEKVLQTGGVVGLENHTVLVRADGETLPIDDSAAPIRDAAGKLFGVILVFHEVSQSRKLQHELLRQTEALKEADRRKDEFLAVLAHELRNPLAPLRNGLAIVRSLGASGHSLSPAVEMMDRQLVHLVRLVNDLMDINRVSRGVIELRLRPVLIEEVLARSLEAVRADIEARGHKLEASIRARDIAVNGDLDRLTQIFSNLLANSCKYSPNGGLIRVEACCDGPVALVRVADRGIGIPPEQLEKVFEMFSQVRGHQGHSDGGLGIGLSLVRTLVQMHGGTVSAHSAGPGTGSTFTVRLPIVGVEHEFPRIEPVPPVSNGRALRIVVADDNDDAARSLQLLLKVEGHEVRTAATGREALTQVDEFRPHLVFMDVGMPDMDGVTATTRIRERLDGQEMMIVALTGWGQPQDRERTRLAGVDRHVVKPIGAEDLAQILTLACERLAVDS